MSNITEIRMLIQRFNGFRSGFPYGFCIFRTFSHPFWGWLANSAKGSDPVDWHKSTASEGQICTILHHLDPVFGSLSPVFDS